jgi:hypothetical protein
MDKKEAKDLVEKYLKQRKIFESFGIEIYEEDGKKRASYLGVVKKGRPFIPDYKEQVIEINFEDNSVLISNPLSAIINRL